MYILVVSRHFLCIFSWLLRLLSTTYYKEFPTHRVHASLVSSTQQSQQSGRNEQKMYMNRTGRFPFLSTKKALILTQEGKEYLYSDVVGIHES